MSGIYQIIGSRIRRTRESLKLSQAELAVQLGYQSAATISHFEAGERKVSIADLQRISQVLHVPLEFFLLESGETEISQYYRFRARELRPALRETVAGFLSFAHANSSEISPRLQELRALEPRQAAAQLLEWASIQEPPVSPTTIAEYLNIAIYEWDFPDEISGIAVAQMGRGCIGVNEAHPRVRQRFTAAHELGHLVRDWEQSLRFDFVGVEPVPQSEDEQIQETWANWFAADLLMPAIWLRRDVHNMGEINMVHLAKRYDVSQQALWFRLLSLKLVDEEHKTDVK